MEKDFLPYEISLSLKELEFDEPCFAWYVSKDYGIEIGMVIKSDLIKESILAPTFSQAFRFFREKYKLSGLIEISTQEYSFIIFDEEKDSRKITSSMNGTYEEAELACLKKLIEIVKLSRHDDR
jgi:hypothetical protein